MKLEDLLAMEVPKKQLDHICSKYELKPQGHSLEGCAVAIASDERSIPEGEDLVIEYKYAGKTAARMYKPCGSILQDFDKNSFYGYLREKYNTEGIFSRGLNIEPNNIPQLFKVEEYKGKVFMSFIYLGPERRIYENYQIKKVQQQIVDFLVIHFNPLVLEVRADIKKDSVFKKSFLHVMGIEHDIEWTCLTELDRDEAMELRKRLSGKLCGSQLRIPDGIYNTIELRARVGVDLSQENEYQQEYGDKDFNKLTFRIPFEYNNSIKDEISVRITKEGINFLSPVSEEVIEYVIGTAVNIKMETWDKITNAAVSLSV